MKLADAILQLYEGNKFVIDRNCEGLTHEASLRQPEVEANCLNWVLGHIIANRMAAYRLLGLGPVWGEDEWERYRRGSDAITPETALSFLDLLTTLDQTQAALAAALADVSEEVLAEGGEDTVGANLLGLAWHETYHAGQTDFLRRLAGRQDGGIR